jgi:adenylate kinase family enzyme
VPTANVDGLAAVRRIAVVGASGAGKSRLATRLADAAGLPLIHLDRLAWRSGWVETDRAEVLREHRRVLTEPAWVIDGNYTNVDKADRMAHADLVLVLEPSRLTAMARVLGRWLRHYGEARPDMAPGCEERLDLGFLWFVWRWHDRHPDYGREIAREAGSTPVIVLRSARDVEHFAARFARSHARAAQAATSRRP